MVPTAYSTVDIPASSRATVSNRRDRATRARRRVEVIREVVGFGEGLVGRLLLVDARAMRFDTLRYGWDERNPLSGTASRPD